MVTWQESAEWWGKSCITYRGDIKATIQQMDEKCFWYIREDEKVLAKGITTISLAKVQKMVASKLSRISLKQTIRRFVRVPSAA